MTELKNASIVQKIIQIFLWITKFTINNRYSNANIIFNIEFIISTWLLIVNNAYDKVLTGPILKRLKIGTKITSWPMSDVKFVINGFILASINDLNGLSLYLKVIIVELKKWN